MSSSLSSSGSSSALSPIAAKQLILEGVQRKLQAKLDASTTLDAELFAAKHEMDALLKNRARGRGGGAQRARERATPTSVVEQEIQLLQRCETVETRASQLAALRERLVIAINHLRGEMAEPKRTLKYCVARAEQLETAISEGKQAMRQTLSTRAALLKLDQRRRFEEDQAKKAHMKAMDDQRKEYRRLKAANEAAEVAYEANVIAAQEQEEAAALAEQEEVAAHNARLDELRWKREGLELIASELVSYSPSGFARLARMLTVGGASEPGRDGEASEAVAAFRDGEEQADSLRSFLANQAEEIKKLAAELAELAEAEEHEVAILERRQASKDESMGDQVHQAAVETEMRRRNGTIEGGLDDVFAAFTSFAQLVECHMPPEHVGQPCTLHTVDAYLIQLDERTGDLLLHLAARRDWPELLARTLRPQSPETTDPRPEDLPSIDDELRPSFLTTNDASFGA